MSTQPLYCNSCKENYNVAKEDLALMKKHSNDFDEKSYTGGCFFKNLGQLKRSLNQKESNDSRCECK